MLNIGKAAVLGAGTMGAAIAAHLSNAGIPTLLLDIAPPDADDNKSSRDKIVKSLFEAAKKLKPAPFMLAGNAGLIETGNFTDDIAKLKDCDFVIEAVVERLDIKHKLFAEVEKHRKAGSVIASNTSGIPIASIAEPFSDDFKKHFVGIHFFNPPRYMKLVEVIPTADTDGEIACAVSGFLDQRLGKGVVPAKDRPNFIANRIGVFSITTAVDVGQTDPLLVELVRIVEPRRVVHRHPGAKAAVAEVRPVAHLAVAEADDVGEAVAGDVGQVDGLGPVGKDDAGTLFFIERVRDQARFAESLFATRGMPDECVVFGDQNVCMTITIKVNELQIRIANIAVQP